MADFFIKRGDMLPAIAAVLRDSSGAEVDLSGLGVVFYMRDFITGALKVSSAATVDPDQVNHKGWVSYDWQTGDTDDAGYCYAEWEVDGRQTFPTEGWHLISISEDLGEAGTAAAENFATIRDLRRMISEPTSDTYSDTLLLAMLAANDDDATATAAQVWREKAAVYSDLVDTQESGSSRKLSQLYDRAMKQALHFESVSGTGEGGAGAENTTTVRKITR